MIPSSPARPGGCEPATAILKGEEGVYAECQLIFVATVEERVISVVIANFRSEQPLREKLVLWKRLDGHAHRGLVIIGADGRTCGEAMGGVSVPLQPGVEREVRIDRVADVACQASPLLGTACYAGDFRSIDVVNAQAEAQLFSDLLRDNQVQRGPPVVVVALRQIVSEARRELRAFRHNENDGGLVTGREGDAAQKIQGIVGVAERLVPATREASVKRPLGIQHVGDQNARLRARLGIEKLVTIRIECPGRIAKGPVDVGAELLEARQFNPFACADSHRHAGDGHVHIGLKKVPLISARLPVTHSIRVDERGIRTPETFHVETKVKLLLRRIDRALDVQTDLVKDGCVLEAVKPDEGWSVVFTLGAEVMHVAAFGVAVDVDPSLVQRLGQSRLA